LILFVPAEIKKVFRNEQIPRVSVFPVASGKSLSFFEPKYVMNFPPMKFWAFFRKSLDIN